MKKQKKKTILKPAAASIKLKHKDKTELNVGSSGAPIKKSNADTADIQSDPCFPPSER